jgi:hypothetical protein
MCKTYWSHQYPVSKLVQIYLVRAIANDHPASESTVTINLVNPGLCHSELARDVNGWSFRLFKLSMARSTEVGSRTIVHAGAAGIETHGMYLSDCMVEEPSALVTDTAGKELQGRVEAEVIKAIDAIQPGVSKNFQTA